MLKILGGLAKFLTCAGFRHGGRAALWAFRVRPKGALQLLIF